MPMLRDHARTLIVTAHAPTCTTCSNEDEAIDHVESTRDYVGDGNPDNVPAYVRPYLAEALEVLLGR